MVGFLPASLVLVVMPGPDEALITRNAIARGPRAGLATLIGGASGIGFHGTAATVGLSALLAASATAFTPLKLVGTASLLSLASQARTVRPTRRQLGRFRHQLRARRLRDDDPRRVALRLGARRAGDPGRLDRAHPGLVLVAERRFCRRR